MGTARLHVGHPSGPVGRVPGPDRDGRIDLAQSLRLSEIGAWLGKHGDSIYDTRGGPFLPGSWGASTHRGNTVYLHVLNWTGDKLVLPAIPARVVRASVQGGGAAKVEQSARGIEIAVPAAARNDMDTVVALQLDAPAEGIAPVR